MLKAIFYGRGGQGVVTSVELLAQAAICEGKHAQGFPSFGPERRGAPVKAFLRVSDNPIFSREKIETPDVVVVMDSTLLNLVDVCKGLKANGIMLINDPLVKIDELESYRIQYQVFLVDASCIAIETLGVPITNTTILGALVRATDIVKMVTLKEMLGNRFGPLAAKNQTAMSKGYEETIKCEATQVSIHHQDKNVGTTSAPEDRRSEEALHPWPEVEIGCDIAHLGSSGDFVTGNWRTVGRPVVNLENCIKCGICWIMCPDTVYTPTEEGFYAWNGQYCKGCGICAEECPKGAIEMKEE